MATIKQLKLGQTVYLKKCSSYSTHSFNEEVTIVRLPEIRLMRYKDAITGEMVEKMVQKDKSVWVRQKNGNEITVGLSKVSINPM